MPIEIVSTTDTPEAVTAAMGDLNPKDETLVPAADKTAETSGTSDAPTEKEEESEETDEEIEEDESKEAKDDDKAPKKRSGFKRRIDKLTTKLSAKDQEIEYWRKEALKSQQPRSTEEKTVRNESESNGRPVAEKFETHEAYVEALVDWKAEQKLKEQETKQNQVRAKTEHETRVATHIDRVLAFKAEHDDFDELMEEVEHIPFTPTIQDSILSSENGPQLMYELAKNPDEYARIAKLPALAAAREMGKFEARLTKSEPSEMKEAKVTKTPPPLRPVGTGKTGSGAKSLDDPSLSQREWEKLREAQIAKRA